MAQSWSLIGFHILFKCMARNSGWHHSLETRAAIAKANTGKDNSSRSAAISASHSQRSFTDKEWEIFEETHKEFPWITNTKAFVKISGIESTFGVVRKARLVEIKNFINPTGKQPSVMLPVSVQLWDRDKIQSFKNDVLNVGKTKLDSQKLFKSRYGLGKKSFCHVVNVLMGIKTTVYPGSHSYFHKTSIERFVMYILDQMNIQYQIQKYINNMKWRVDFLLDNSKVIETNGTYHHADPRVFRECDLDAIQEFNVSRDKEKLSWLYNNGFDVLVIWQKDIQEKPEWVIQELQSFIGAKNGKGKFVNLIQTSLWD